jgi:hypothetical protein
MAEEKSTLTEVREAFAKTRNALKKTEQKVEEKTGAVLRWTLTVGSGWLAGAGHELVGKMDERAGQKIARVGGVNIGVMASFAGLGAELLEAGGKNSEWLGAAGGGVGAQAAGDMGRVFVRTVRKNKADKDAEKVTELAKKAATDAAAAKKTEESAPAAATGT